MSYAAAILIVLASAALAGAASRIVDRFVSVDTRKRQHDVGFQIFAIIGLMFSVLLAFVFSEVWSEYNAARQAISGECGALHGAAMIAGAMPNHEGRPINEDIKQYVDQVLTVEWPTMTQQRRSIEAAHGLRAAIETTAQLPVTSASDLSNRGTILGLLAQAHAAREARTFQLDLGLPGATWFVLIVLTFVLSALVALAGTERHATVFFSAIFTASVVMVLVLVRMLDYPFEGALAVSSADFVKLGSQLSDLLAMK
ncbi:MAG TPA: hypothetical protein VIM56_10670 [Rhizomicrobium sp.]